MPTTCDDNEEIVVVDDLPATDEHTEMQRRIVDASNDLRQPIYSDEHRSPKESFHVPMERDQDDITAVCLDANWSPQIHDPDELPVWLALARLLPTLGMFYRPPTDPNTAAYHWAKARCLFAGAGYRHHDAIAEVLNGLYPVCDLTVGETEQEWVEALQKAHAMCGWPVHLGRIHWQRLVWGMSWVDRTHVPEIWHKVMAVLHVLKHVRTRGNRIAITFGGLASLVPAPDSNVIALAPATLNMVTQALGMPLAKRDSVHPLTLALQLALKQVSLDRLLMQRPLAELPGTMIAGPWSSVEPDPSASEGFIQSGLRLSGVWNASNGTVNEYPGTSEITAAWGWNVSNPSMYADIRDALIACMPRTYPTEWPGDMLLNDFPNIELSWATDPDCAKVLLELPIFASLLRKTGESMAREFPFVLFLPDTPTMEDSTNQGKTALTRTLVRAMAPGCPTVVPPDTSSAPDNRAFVDVLAQYGTAGLDEWAPPKTKSHPLSHQNLQTLCTGGGVTFGRVLENSGMVTLRHSLVAGCKAVDFPPDMISRTIAWPLRQFTDAERNRADVKARVDSGQASMQLRLAALHKIETYDIPAKLAVSPGAINSSLRFDAHATLAGLLYEIRTGKKCTTLSTTVQEMRCRFSRHVADAATSGVLSAQEHGGYLHIRLPDVFAGCGSDVLGIASQEMAAMSVNTAKQLGKGWNSMTHLLAALQKARGFPTMQAMLPAITGGKARASDRQMVMALARSTRAIVIENGVYEIPETDWTLERGPDVSNAMRVRLVQKSLLQTGGGQNESWGL